MGISCCVSKSPHVCKTVSTRTGALWLVTRCNDLAMLPCGCWRCRRSCSAERVWVILDPLDCSSEEGNPSYSYRESSTMSLGPHVLWPPCQHMSIFDSSSQGVVARLPSTGSPMAEAIGRRLQAASVSRSARHAVEQWFQKTDSYKFKNVPTHDSLMLSSLVTAWLIHEG